MADDPDRAGVGARAPLPPPKLHWEQRRFSHCQASEDECSYEHCPRWKGGKIINDAHCSLDLIGRDDD